MSQKKVQPKIVIETMIPTQSSGPEGQKRSNDFFGFNKKFTYSNP
jgi:hypothetical protein